MAWSVLLSTCLFLPLYGIPFGGHVTRSSTCPKFPLFSHSDESFLKLSCFSALSPSSYLSLLFIHLLVTPTGTQALREFHLWGSKKRTRRVHFFKCCEAGQLRANRCLGSAANQKLRAPFLNSPCANCVLSCAHQLLHDVFLVNLVSISSLETKTISNTQ